QSGEGDHLPIRHARPAPHELGRRDHQTTGRPDRRGRWMSLFLRLAMRNIFRNRTRTLVTLLSISAGCAALILNAGVVLNIFRELREDAIHGRLGHLQIYRRGYSERHLEDPESVLLSPEMTSQVLAQARSNRHVLRATRRREFAGIISN